MRIPTIVLGMLMAAAGSGYAATPADPNASPEARNLLNWLESLPERSSDKVVSGQYQAAIIEVIDRECGKRVGLLGDWFIDGRSSWIDDSDGVRNRQAMLDHWMAGGIVTIYMPMHNPKTRGGEKDRDFTDLDMDAAITAGTAINANLNQWLDTWAVHARWLADRDVPLIARPMHEMNQPYFWWGEKDPVRYKALWKYIFSYLRVEKGLHNLLFAYAEAWWDPQNTQGAYYPGGDFVDIVGFDLYRDISDAGEYTAEDFAAYRALEGLGKPIALTECGPKKGSGPSATKADYRKLMAGIKTYGPKIVYWFSWNGRWSMRAADNAFVPELLNDAWTINCDEIPNLKANVPQAAR